ncbi:MAG: hypothetical protein IKD75_06785 [Prevotella sp.]|jgi:hypothetical protein|nr:hypothetical protein [Prevotella sp.]MBR6844733.1 hypothetical protein [Bacteroidales bacterium]
MEWLDTFIGLIGGGTLVTLATLPSIIKKAKTDVVAAQLDNMQKVADGWKAIADERQEACQEKERVIADKDAKIDALYIQLGTQREAYNAKVEENTELKVYKATNEVKLCMRRGCGDREPQSGY